MKNQLLILIAAFLFLLSCKPKTKDKPGRVPEFTESEFENYQGNDTVFLGLSPNMTNKQFENEKAKENGKRLNNGEFKIFLENQIMAFNIAKTPTSIQLQFSERLSKNDLRKNLDKKTFNQLFDLLDSKYNYHESPDFENHLGFNKQTNTYGFFNQIGEKKDSTKKQLADYGLNQTDYAIFNNSTKTIALGFSVRKSRNIGDIPPTFIEDKDGNFKKNPIKEEDIKWYIFSTTIDYFLNKDFDSLQQKINQDYKNHMNSLRSMIDEEIKAMDNLKKNKSEL